MGCPLREAVVQVAVDSVAAFQVAFISDFKNQMVVAGKMIAYIFTGIPPFNSLPRIDRFKITVLF
jgi:hypothetical protein